MAASNIDHDKLRLGLFLLRLSTGLFFLMWSVDKLINTGHTLKVFEKFYFMDISNEVGLGLGVAQTAVILAFMAGMFKPWPVLALLAMHTVSVGSTWARLINPYEGSGLLFWAAVPVWFGLLLLYWMRDADTMGVLKLGK